MLWKELARTALLGTEHHTLASHIMEQLMEPRTAKQVAVALEENPTKLYHHFNALKEAGLIKLLEVRPNRGTWEKYYQAVARRFVVDDQLFNFSKKASESKSKLHQVEDQIGSLLEDVRDSHRQGLLDESVGKEQEKTFFRKAKGIKSKMQH